MPRPNVDFKDEKLVFTCRCGDDGTVLSVTEWNDSDSKEILFTLHSRPLGIWRKLSGLIRYRDCDYHEIVLGESDIMAMRDKLDELIRKNEKYVELAGLVIRHAPLMGEKQRKNIASWLRKHADDLVKNGDKYDENFDGHFVAPKRVEKE